MKNDFLTKEIHRIVGTRRASDLFKTSLDKFDLLEKLQVEMAANMVQFKLQRKHYRLILERLQMVA